MQDHNKPLHIVGKIRSVTEGPTVVWVMAPGGRIKPIYCTVGVEPWQLTFEWIPDQTNPERMVGLRSVAITPAAHRAGWRLLRDLYEQEGRLDDWETFQTRLCTLKDGYGSDSKSEYSDDYLPDYVILARQSKGTGRVEELPPPQRQKIAKRSKAAES